jgi:hypothetical protein
LQLNLSIHAIIKPCSAKSEGRRAKWFEYCVGHIFNDLNNDITLLHFLFIIALLYKLDKFISTKRNVVKKNLNIGDHVSWNSEAGRVTGTIVKVHTKDFEYKGYIHHANKDDPQYEIKSDKSDHIAAHKGGALTLIK